MREAVVLESLENWQALNERINTLDEDELKLALNTEMSYGRRKQFVIRLHARHTKIKAARERAELLARCE